MLELITDTSNITTTFLYLTVILGGNHDLALSTSKLVSPDYFNLDPYGVQ